MVLKDDWYEQQQARYLQDQPGLEILRDMLLEQGGRRVALREEMDLEALISGRAKPFPTRHMVVGLGPGHDCHTNVALLYEQTRGFLRWATGWMLMRDGIWRQHSWGWDGKRIWETKGRALKYWGIELTASEVKARA